MLKPIPASCIYAKAASIAGALALCDCRGDDASLGLRALVNHLRLALFNARATLLFGHDMDRAIIAKGPDQEKHEPHASRSRRRSLVTDVAQVASNNLKEIRPGIIEAANKAAIVMPDRAVRSGENVGGSSVIAKKTFTTFYSARRAENRNSKW